MCVKTEPAIKLVCKTILDKTNDVPKHKQLSTNTVGELPVNLTPGANYLKVRGHSHQESEVGRYRR